MYWGMARSKKGRPCSTVGGEPAEKDASPVLQRPRGESTPGCSRSPDTNEDWPRVPAAAYPEELKEAWRPQSLLTALSVQCSKQRGSELLGQRSCRVQPDPELCAVRCMAGSSQVARLPVLVQSVLQAAP
ncbi:hypothetical protein UY3_15637 [Chelonia mydas]|uniref:Uncharacterized protein n=1 Tax=Chelonia mydas TaxID=8469 RepID=M7BGA9_CHEMY|nr:hypothetical protein UY3_15637 [Chelonia mydas]